MSSPLQQVDRRRARRILGIFSDDDGDRSYWVCPQGHGSEAP